MPLLADTGRLLPVSLAVFSQQRGPFGVVVFTHPLVVLAETEPH